MGVKSFSISKVINTNPETLFAILSKFESYPNWTTIIPSAQGELKEGTQLKLVLSMSGVTKPFGPKVKLVEKGKYFLLSKVFLSSGIGELTHRFDLKKLENNQTELVQTWEGKGLLVQLMWPKIKKGFSSFEILNDDLAQHIGALNTNNL